MTASSPYSTLRDARRRDSWPRGAAIGRSTNASRRLTIRSAVRAISFLSLLAGLPWVERLLAAGLGATLAVLGAIVGLQLLALLAFRLVGLLPTLEESEIGDEAFGQAWLGS